MFCDMKYIYMYKKNFNINDGDLSVMKIYYVRCLT